MNPVIYSYKGNQIPFEKGKDVLVNLTAMAKPFPEKNLSQIVNSLEIREYINALTEIQNYSSADLLIVRKGGDISQQGTWAHRLVAIRVAQKLNSDFAVWVDMKIDELLRTGVTTIDNLSRKDIALMLLQSEEEKERLQLQAKEDAPKVLFTNAVTSSNTNILINDMAKLLRQNGIDIGQNRLYEWLVQNKYLICRKRWSKKKNKYENDYMPTQKAADLEIFFVDEMPIVGSSGSFIKHTIKVTGKGQIYFINKFLKEKAA